MEDYVEGILWTDSVAKLLAESYDSDREDAVDRLLATEILGMV